MEIKEWLMLNGNDVTRYAILDDMDDILLEKENHFVWINPELGITEEDAEKAIAILNQE